MQTGSIAVTGTDGKAVVGQLRSSDRVTQSVPVFAYVPVGPRTDSRTPYASINQVMGGEWKMGENGELPWNQNFVPGQTKSVVYAASLTELLNGMIPTKTTIKGHVLRFVPVYIKVREHIFPNSTLMESHIYQLLDPDIITVNENLAVRKNLDFLKKYVHFGNAQTGYADITDNNDGKYKAAITVPYSPDWIVEEVRVGLKDVGTYVKK